MALFEHENECACSYTVGVVLAVIALTISIRNSAYFAYKYMNRVKKTVVKKSLNYQTTLPYQTYKMTANVKSIHIKNRTYYFNNDMTSKTLDSSLLKIDKKSHKNIGIYNIKYTTIKKIDNYKNIHSVNPLYLMIGKVNRYIKEEIDIQFLILLIKTKKY